MPHQCVRCSKIYHDGSEEILKGCNCGGKMFFYIRKEKLEKAKEATKELSKKDKKEIEKEVLDIIGESQEDDQPVILDFEAINVKEPGKFELDLTKLFSTDSPLVYKLGDGKYVIDVVGSFDKNKKDKKKKK